MTATADWGNKTSEGETLLTKVFARGFLCACALFSFPLLAMLIVAVNFTYDGSFSDMLLDFSLSSPSEVLAKLFLSPFSPRAWKLILSYSALQLFFMQAIPCSKHKGPVTQTGHIPIYNANGFQSWVGTIAVFLACVAGGVFNGGIIYDTLPEIIAAMNLFSLIFCLGIYLKGAYFPSTKDSGTSGNFFYDYYAGVELYPRVFGVDIKQFTNCRFGMMLWGIQLISYAFKQYELNGYISDSMLVTTILQLVYVTKFFWWETGYFDTIDIAHDRAGFYLCWGCMVWIPSMYSLTSCYMVRFPLHLGSTYAAVILVLGLFSVALNYFIDAQRTHFRKKNGKIQVFGKPAKYIEAQFSTDDGKVRTALLLTSGWWGLARKLNYTLEIMAAFCWCWPSQFSSVFPYSYCIFLAVLLLDRAFRDDARCSKKYGKWWKQYCGQVPYIVIPGIL